MKWPRGKYNNQRIIGVEIKTKIIVNYWRLAWQLDKYLKYIHIGPVIMHFEFHYEWRNPGPQPK